MKKYTNRKELLSCSCIQRVNRREQKGRSMLEILGVLAIIGVLSSGGVLAYNFLMNKHKANGLMEKALDEAVLISEKIRKKNSLKISHKNRSVFSSAEKVGLSHFKISLVPVDTSVCKQLKSMLDRTSLVYDISEDCSYMLFANILGEDSVIMSDLCAGKNCGHGFCSAGACICQDDYYGENCENAPLACQNGGSWNTTTHQCDCPNGYSGNTCGIKDPCLDVNCGTHGTCSGGSCVCTDDYYGDRCQTAPLACQNGGTWNTTTHVCDCISGAYSGDTCENFDPCYDVDCGTHGTCSNGACVCDGGYYLDGTECTMCPAGTYAATGANVCTPCPDGMTSDAGATSANDCESEGVTCQNGGTWNASTGQCDCAYGYTGDDCSINGICVVGGPGTQAGICSDDPCDYDLLNEYCYKKDAECDAKYTCPASYNQCVSENVFYCEGEVGGSGVNSAYSSSNGCTCRYFCYTGDTPIMLADGTCKRADEITYDDELLVWDFDNGCFAKSKPLWLKIAQTAPQYNYLRFSDGSVLKTISQHRIFNREAGKFTYPMTDETPIGTHTLNAKGEWVTLEEKKVIQEEVTYYNIITDYHLNCFTGNILTSCRLNNLYPIKDMKFVKDERELVPYLEYAELPRKWYDGLRLAEQPREVNRGNDIVRENTLTEYVQRLIRMAQ